MFFLLLRSSRAVGRSANMVGQAVIEGHLLNRFSFLFCKNLGDDFPTYPRFRRPCITVSSSSRVLPTIDNHTTVTRCQKGREIYIDSIFAIEFYNNLQFWHWRFAKIVLSCSTRCQKGRTKFTSNCVPLFFFTMICSFDIEVVNEKLAWNWLNTVSGWRHYIGILNYRPILKHNSI